MLSGIASSILGHWFHSVIWRILSPFSKPQISGTLSFREGSMGGSLMLRVPSISPSLDRRIAALEELLSKLDAVPPNARSPDYLPWKEEYLVERLAELKRSRGER